MKELMHLLTRVTNTGNKFMSAIEELEEKSPGFDPEELAKKLKGEDLKTFTNIMTDIDTLGDRFDKIF